MRKLWNKRIGGSILLAGIFFLGGGLPASAGQYILADRQSVSNPELDAMRGGFITNNGFQFSMGIIKAVLVDGVLKTISSLNIPNMANLNGSFKNAPAVELPKTNAPGAVSGNTASVPTSVPATAPVSVPVSSPATAPAPVTTSVPEITSAATPPPATVNNTPQAQTGTQQAEAIPAVQNTGNPVLIQQGSQMPAPQSSGSTIVGNAGNATLIQNNANQKVIQNMTVLNLTTNSVSMFRQMNISANLRQQFINMLH